MNPASGCKIGWFTMKSGGARIRVIEQAKAMPEPNVVKYLEEALEMALAGQLRSVAIAAMYADRTATTAYAIAAEQNPVHLLGAIEWARDRVMDVVYESA